MPIPFSVNGHTQRIQTEAQELFEMMSKKKEKPITVKIDPAVSFAGVISRKNQLRIHPLALIQPADLPPELRISGTKDSKLNNKNYFENLKKWIAKKFDLKETSLANLESLFWMHLYIWTKPEMIDRVRRFILAHEMAHVYFKHRSSKWDTALMYIVVAIVAGLMYAFFPNPLLLGLVFISGLVAGKVLECLRKYCDQSHEREADLKALEVTKDYEGATYFFNFFKKFHEIQWNDRTWCQLIKQSLFEPEKIFNVSHPSPEERIAYLKAASLKA